MSKRVCYLCRQHPNKAKKGHNWANPKIASTSDGQRQDDAFAQESDSSASLPKTHLLTLRSRDFYTPVLGRDSSRRFHSFAFHELAGHPRLKQINNYLPITSAMNKQKELHENELAAWLAKINTSIEPYSKIIAVVVFAVIAGAIGWGLYSSKVSGDRSDATLQLLMKDPEVAEKYPGTPAAAWSLLYSANDDLESGIASLYMNRDDAETMLSQARDTFGDAIKASDDPLLRSRAHLGLAMTAESLGEIDGAIDSYRDVIKLAESDAMVAKAKSRIDELSSPDTKEFIAWFKEQDFAPADPALPPELPSGNTLPDIPDLSLPTLGGGDDDDEMALEEDKSGLELPPLDKSAGDAKSDKSDDSNIDDAKTDDSDDAKTSADESSEKKSAGDSEESTDK